jgi:hypothetical protein
VFDLELNESPDLLNVTVDARGGILLRDGVKTLAQTALASNVNGIWSYHNDDGTSKVLVNYGTTVAVYDGTNFDSTGAATITARTDGSRTYGVTINNVAYAVSGDVTSFYYNGTSFTNLGTTLDGSAGNFPIAQYVEHWNNFASRMRTCRPSGTIWTTSILARARAATTSLGLSAITIVW